MQLSIKNMSDAVVSLMSHSGQELTIVVTEARIQLVEQLVGADSAADVQRLQGAIRVIDELLHMQSHAAEEYRARQQKAGGMNERNGRRTL